LTIRKYSHPKETCGFAPFHPGTKPLTYDNLLNINGIINKQKMSKVTKILVIRRLKTLVAEPSTELSTGFVDK
jgi:hypothetical protein